MIEAKSPGEDLGVALQEPRLYATEINAQYPHNINPCFRVIVSNGERIFSAPIDTDVPDIELSNAELTPANQAFAHFIQTCRRSTTQHAADKIRRQLKQQNFTRPISQVGGSSFQNEELPQNTFGATIVGDYGHIFDPQSPEDRERIARDAYIASLRHQRYIEPIDRLIRNAVAPTAAKLKPLEDSSKPQEIITALRDRKRLENQVILLVGSVGAGKSTFVDYLSTVALPKEIKDKTRWLRIDLNDAPLQLETAYTWLSQSITNSFRATTPNIDFDEHETLKKIFYSEINALRKGPLGALDPSSEAYKLRIADKLTDLQRDSLITAKGIAQFIRGGPNLLLVIALDNCDKRTRDEQLLMFQIAQWVQSEFRCLVILPLRDVTYDLYRHDKPLDTALKQFVFRIEPPAFSDVLQARVKLALAEISRSASSASTLSYTLPNGAKVSYPSEDQALYLASILRSLYAHDRFVRQVMTGLAGRNVRRALEIFLDFCISGHIGEDQIFKIRFMQGQHVLPLAVVARVLLRMSRRFYDGTTAYLKNIFQCDPSDPLPDHFVRLAILHWYSEKIKVQGPAGVEGFHRANDMIAELCVIGHDANRVRAELTYLAKEECIIPEHLRTGRIDDHDLIKISAAGLVHLQLLVNPEYLAACAEDTFVSNAVLAKRIAQRIGSGFESHFSPITTNRNAAEFVEYLKQQAIESLSAPEVFLEEGRSKELKLLKDAEAGVAAAEIALPERLFVGGLASSIKDDELRSAFKGRGVALQSMTLPKGKGRENRGFAFVEPANKSGVLAALELDGQIRLHGTLLRITEAHRLEEEHFKLGGRERKIVELSTRIFLANLPYSSDATDIRSLLAEIDLTPKDIFLLSDKKTKKPRGAGFLEMATLDDAARVIGELDGRLFNGRRLTARPADPKPISQ